MIIGNSPDVLNQELGDVIDSMDLIVRLNNFETRGYERYVGSRCDIAFMTFATKFSSELYEMNRENLYLFVAERFKCYDFLQERMSREGASGILPHEVNILSNEYYEGLRQCVGLKGRQRATIGLIALVWCRRFFSDAKLFMHGINFFEGQGKLLHHYSGHTTPSDDYHDFNKEKKYFDSELKNYYFKLT